MVADRLPPVNPNGTASLSPTTTRTCSNGTPNSSAAICARVVWWLCPCGIWPVNKVTTPSSASHRRMCSRPIGPLGAPGERGPGAPSMKVARPMPR